MLTETLKHSMTEEWNKMVKIIQPDTSSSGRYSTNLLTYACEHWIIVGSSFQMHPIWDNKLGVFLF